MTTSDDFDTCKEVSRQEVLRLRAQGLDARWIQVAGLAVSAPDADERWNDVEPASRLHYVVKIDDEYHDLAPRQFWPDAPVPLIERDYLRRWDKAYDVTSGLKQWKGV